MGPYSVWANVIKALKEISFPPMVQCRYISSGIITSLTMAGAGNFLVKLEE